MSTAILLGKITRAFGLKGGVVIKMLNEHSEALKIGSRVQLNSPSVPVRHLVVDNMIDGDRYFFTDIIDRNQAEELKGATVWIDRADLPALADDEFYLDDILHADIVDLQGQLLGQVVGFSSNGVQMLFEIKTTAGHHALVPAIKPIISHIDYVNKTVILDAPMGLLDPLD